jgi:CBS domain-containing protein
MTIAVHALPEDAPIAVAIRLFTTLKVEQLPVVDERGRLSGMFSRSDVVRWLANELGTRG